MRLKEDTSSYRASGVIVRDARHVHNGPEVPRAVRGKKDRKRWCGGHVGREHKPQCMVKREWDSRFGDKAGKAAWYVLACTQCGKELEHWFPWTGRFAVTRPAWVVEAP